MTAPSWPPEEHHPIEDWTDHELIDQYRYLKGDLADQGLESEDGPLDALVEEIGRRGLEALADDVDEDPASAGRAT